MKTKLSFEDRELIVMIVKIVKPFSALERLRLAATLAQQFSNKNKN